MSQAVAAALMFNVDDPWHVKAPRLLPALNGAMDVLHLVLSRTYRKAFRNAWG